MNDAVNLIGLAKQLVETGLLDEKKAADAVLRAKQNKMSLVTWLAQNKLVKSNILMRVAGEQFGIPYFDLKAMNPEVFPKDLISEKLARQYRALPLYKYGNKLFVAVSDPGSLQAVKDIQFSTGLLVEALLVEEISSGKPLIPCTSR